MATNAEPMGLAGEAEAGAALGCPTVEARAGATITVPIRIKAAWGAGGLGAQLAINMMGPLALFYLTTLVGVPPSVAGTIIMLSKLWDAFSDPFTGVISDRSTSDKGRRRPFLFWGAIITAISLVAAFAIPFPGDSWMAWGWALITLILITSGYSMFNVPYMAMPAEMTTEYHERSSIHSYRVMFAALGTMLAGSGAGILLGMWGTPNPRGGPPVNTADDYFNLALIFGVLALVTMLIAWAGTARAPMVARTERTLPLLDQARAIVRNRPFMVIISAKALQLLGVSASGAATFFLVTNVLQQSPALMAWIGIPFAITAFSSGPLLVIISRRIGKRATLATTLLFPAFTSLSWLLAEPGDPVWTLAVRGALVGIGFAGSMLFALSMLTDAIEIDSVRTGMRREGTYMAVYSFAEKFAAAFGPAIVGFALAWAGFSKDAPVTPESYARVRDATMFGSAWIPFVCASSAAILVTFFYRIDHAELERAKGMFARRVAA